MQAEAVWWVLLTASVTSKLKERNYSLVNSQLDIRFNVGDGDDIARIAIALPLPSNTEWPVLYVMADAM